MLNKIIDGISKKLDSTFGNKYKIYTEQIKQGLKTPCFIIQLLNPQNTKLVGNRYLREGLFCIQFFPKSRNEPKTECQQMLDDLYLVLEYIKVDGDLQRGIKMRGEFVEGVLHFFVNYNVIVKKAEDIALMEILEVPDVRTKG